MPILYSFRRCPYAIRARWALLSSNIDVELREVILKDKPDEFLSVSRSGTVPCLQLKDKIIDESIDIMIWALRKNDPDSWLDMPVEGYSLIDEVAKLGKIIYVLTPSAFEKKSINEKTIALIKLEYGPNVPVYYGPEEEITPMQSMYRQSGPFF